MNRFGVDGRWLVTECLRVGCIVLIGFLSAHLLSLFIGAFGVELLYGIEGTLVAVIRYTTLLTAFLYAITKAVTTPSSSVVQSDD